MVREPFMKLMVENSIPEQTAAAKGLLAIFKGLPKECLVTRMKNQVMMKKFKDYLVAPIAPHQAKITILKLLEYFIETANDAFEDEIKDWLRVLKAVIDKDTESKVRVCAVEILGHIGIHCVGRKLDLPQPSSTQTRNPSNLNRFQMYLMSILDNLKHGAKTQQDRRVIAGLPRYSILVDLFGLSIKVPDGPGSICWGMLSTISVNASIFASFESPFHRRPFQGPSKGGQ